MQPTCSAQVMLVICQFTANLATTRIQPFSRVSGALMSGPRHLGCRHITRLYQRDSRTPVHIHRPAPINEASARVKYFISEATHGILVRDKDGRDCIRLKRIRYIRYRSLYAWPPLHLYYMQHRLLRSGADSKGVVRTAAFTQGRSWSIMSPHAL